MDNDIELREFLYGVERHTSSLDNPRWQTLDSVVWEYSRNHRKDLPKTTRRITPKTPTSRLAHGSLIFAATSETTNEGL